MTLIYDWKLTHEQAMEALVVLYYSFKDKGFEPEWEDDGEEHDHFSVELDDCIFHWYASQFEGPDDSDRADVERALYADGIIEDPDVDGGLLG